MIDLPEALAGESRSTDKATPSMPSPPAATEPARPEAEAQAVFDRFLARFTDADVEAVLDCFWHDALFWGTTMTALATEASGVRGYFNGLSAHAPQARIATWISGAVLALSEEAVLVSGEWQILSRADGTIRPLRVSAAVTRRGGVWKMAQFHNSARP